MLTSDLAMSYRRGEKIFPFLIQTDNLGFLRDAESLVEIFEQSINKTRGEIERELEEYIGTGTDYNILRGLIKLLKDRSEFEVSAPAEPLEIRQKVFLEAKKFHPVLPNSEAKTEVLNLIASEFETDAKTIAANLYADLSAQQRLTEFETIEPETLLDLYNLSQAQAIFYRCVEMKIRVAPSDAANYRAVFGWVKHFGLIHSVSGNSEKGYEITLTGAASLFQKSQKYGIQMAVFLPALLLCGNWKMRAEINDKRGILFYELTSEQTELVSNRLDQPEYENPIHEKLLKAWEKSAVEWKLKKNKEVIDLGKTAFIPDYVLISPDKKKIYLDVLGFWTPKSLQKRLEEFHAANYKKFILAAWQDLRGSREEPTFDSENVVFFKSKLEPLLISEMARKLI
ncbi:MAG TPA: DUF790 family protein [Pyrinomonadaceae bacterium]|nr:DUF790 family protein [Pyrinomonadaceae bacterium]